MGRTEPGQAGRRAGQLESQAALLELVAGGAPSAAVLEALVGAVERQLAPNLCAVIARGREGDGLDSACSAGLPAALRRALDAALSGGDAWSGDPWSVDTVRRAALAGGLDGMCARPLRSAEDGVLLGMLIVFYRPPQKPGESDGETLDLLGRPAAVALELERRAQAIRLADERFTSLTASVPGVVYQRRVAPDGDIRYTYISEGVRELFGIAPEEVLADPAALFSRHDPTYAADFRERLFSASRRLEMWDVEATIITRDGQQKFTHAIARPHRQPDGAVLWNGLILDQTRIKRAELAAAAAEATTRQAIVESLSQGLVMFSADDRLTICNSAYLALYPRLQGIAATGISYEQVVSAELVDEAASADDAGERLRRRLDQHGLRHHNLERQLADGRWILVNERRTPDGGTIALHSDISGIKQREHERAQLQEQFHRAQKMDAMGRLSGGIAHDFNNILASILGNAGFLVQDLPAGSEVAGYAKQIILASQRAKHLIQQIVTFSRQQPNDEMDIDADAVMIEVVELMRAAIPKSIQLDLKRRAPGTIVRGNATELSQLLMNLCINARDAIGHRHGSIELSADLVPDAELSTSNEAAERADPRIASLHCGTSISTGRFDPSTRYLRMRVRDSGCGIDTEILSRIFEPFFTTKEVGKGTGLGLAAVHGIVSSMKGVVTCTSRPGHGATFEVYLPVKNGPSSALARQEQQANPGGTEAILIVDDEQLVSTMLASSLTRLGYTVDCFASAIEALEAVRRNPNRWALAITDQTMPHMTGFELARQILTHHPNFPIILCSGYTDAVTAESVVAAGVRAFLNKPVDHDVMARTIRNVLDTSQQSNALLAS